MTTKSQATAADISALLRARNALIWVITREEARVERYLFEACASAGYPAVRFWDCGEGVTSLDGSPANIGSADIGETLTAIRSRANAGTDGWAKARSASSSCANCATSQGFSLLCLGSVPKRLS